MTISQVIKTSSLLRLETEILLSFLLKKPREFIITHPETKITPIIIKKFKNAEKKRFQNYPLAYLTGTKEFYGLDFKVTPSVLVPRPETEMIIEEITKIAKTKIKPIIIDLGTGSGAIIITLAKELKRLAIDCYNKSEFKAVDISVAALNVAKANAKIHQENKKIKFFRGDLLTPITKQLKNRELIIAANLPYLTLKQIKQSPSISREPRLALDGGKDGLEYYNILFKQLTAIPFSAATIICEIDPSQSQKINLLFKKHYPSGQIKIQNDLSKRNRFAIIRLNNG